MKREKLGARRPTATKTRLYISRHGAALRHRCGEFDPRAGTRRRRDTLWNRDAVCSRVEAAVPPPRRRAGTASDTAPAPQRTAPGPRRPRQDPRHSPQEARREVVARPTPPARRIAVTQNRKRNDPRPRLMATSHMEGTSTLQNAEVARSRIRAASRTLASS